MARKERTQFKPGEIVTTLPWSIDMSTSKELRRLYDATSELFLVLETRISASAKIALLAQSLQLSEKTLALSSEDPGIFEFNFAQVVGQIYQKPKPHRPRTFLNWGVIVQRVNNHGQQIGSKFLVEGTCVRNGEINNPDAIRYYHLGLLEDDGLCLTVLKSQEYILPTEKLVVLGYLDHLHPVLKKFFLSSEDEKQEPVVLTPRRNIIAPYARSTTE